jgi:mycothiol synthase
MAHINTPPIDRPDNNPDRYRRPNAEQRRSALAVLLTGRPTPNHPAVDHFIAFAHQQGLSLDGLWAAYDNQTPVYTSLIIPGIGHTAVLFVSPVQNTQHIPLAADLIRTVVSSQDPDEIRLIQVLLEPTQKREEQALTHAGFTTLASLMYMRRSSMDTAPPNHPDWASPDVTAPIECDGKALSVVTWHEYHHDIFARAIETSYLDTHDCPGLVGIRRIDDIIAGHKAVGRFDPGLWSAYYLDDQPAAVLLLNRMIDRTELELVYLGLSPAFRGKGLASRLMQHALSLARVHNDTGIHLAVDQENGPAMKLYKRLGFRATGRKLAMIYVLK